MKTTALPHPAVDALRRVVGGKACTVLGAAALRPSDPPAVDGMLVAVNGGISSVKGDPDVWFVNSRSSQFDQWGPSRRRLAHLMLKQGKGKTVPLAIFYAREAEAPRTTLAILATHRTRVATWEAISQADRRYLESDAGARLDPQGKDALSAGTTAAALCLLAGATEVRLLGFSWDPGYAYLPGERIDARGHVRADQTALVLLEARYGSRLVHTLPIPRAIAAAVATRRRA